MKALVSSLIFLGFLFSPQVFADDVTYVAGLKGIECAGCKRTISRSLGKIKGVKTIRITKVSDDRHNLTIVTDGTSGISRADAIKALGKDSHYELLSWSKG